MDLLRNLRARVETSVGLQAVVAGLTTFVVYALFRRADNPYNQYALLADAFLDGRLHLIDPPEFLEIARFGEKSFVIDPPAPVAFLIPFAALFGAGLDHVLVSCAVGAGAVSFVWVTARRLQPTEGLEGDDFGFAVLITVAVAFGTNLFWLSSDGGFWSFAHVAAVFFLAAALAEALGKRRPALVGLLVGLAGLSRLPAFLIAPLFVYLALDGDLKIKRATIEKLVWFGGALGACALLYLTYNYARYGTITDLGYYHPQYVGEPWFARGRFDITYVPRHIKAIVYELPARIDGFPYIGPRWIGTSLFLTTPFLLYAFRAKFKGDHGRRNIAAIAGVLATGSVLFTHGAVGFSQFGYRFAMDLLPALLLLVASGMRGRVTKPGIALVSLSVLMNLWGVLAFNHFDWVSF